MFKRSIVAAIAAVALLASGAAWAAGVGNGINGGISKKPVSTFTLIKNGKGKGNWKGGGGYSGNRGHHRGGGGFWLGVPLIAGGLLYAGTCYSQCRQWNGPRYCHAYCGY